jgi:hypothetical protein
MAAVEVVASYKKLGLVEEAFRNLKTVQLEVRPVFHKTDDRIRSHVFLCTLAYYLQWHFKQRLEPLFAADGTHKDRQWTVRNIMGLLRASVDAVMVGARTVHDVSPEGLWIPEYAYPDAKHLYTDYRLSVLHKPKYPLVVVVSGSGALELDRAVFRTPEVRTVVITTPSGRDALDKAGASRFGSVAIHALDTIGDSIDPLTMIQFHCDLGSPVTGGQRVLARSH